MKSRAVTLIAAVAFAFALRSVAAPVGYWWALIPTLAVAIALVCANGTSPAVAFRRGWCAGLAYVLAALGWIIVSAVGHLGPVLGVFGILIAALEAFPIAVAAWGFARSRSAPMSCLGVPAIYALLETARASGPLGVPLATLGATQTAGPLAVLLTVGGVPLTSFAALTCAASLVFAIRTIAVSSNRFRAVFSAFGIVSFAGVALAIGTYRWNAEIAARPNGAIARVGIVEAGPIDVGRSFASSARDYARATRALPKNVDFAIWPEGILFFTAPDAPQQQQIAMDASRTFGRPILVGATLRVHDALQNALLAYDARGDASSLYVKRRLVPFGEYQPFAFAAAKRATYSVPSQSGVTPIRVGRAAPLGALICYEVAFEDLTRASVNGGAQFIVAVLNDTWFAGTDGPAQLAQLAQARAIESGVAIVRVDAVPPSGAIDVDGSWIGTNLDADGVATRNIPAGIVTPFRRIGPVPTVVALCLLFLASFASSELTCRSGERDRSRRSDRRR